MANHKARTAVTVSQSDFVSNPAPVLKRAEQGASVTLTDSSGSPRVVICIPNKDLK